MQDTRNEIIASIARARLELDGALEDVKTLPMVDPMTFGFITHALNNYLQVTLGTIGLLSEELEDDRRQDVGIWLKGLKEVTLRMRHLVAEMRSGPREAGPQMHFEKIDLTTLVRRATDFYRRSAVRKDIGIVCELPSTPLAKVRTDRLAVAAILDNLLSNAVKFSRTGGEVVVALRQEGEKVVCSVRDQGPGIDPRDRGNLFVRGSTTRTSPNGGKESDGFGLAVAAELVAGLGGEIGCDSERGQGACFFFRLPGPRRIGRAKPSK